MSWRTGVRVRLWSRKSVKTLGSILEAAERPETKIEMPLVGSRYQHPAVKEGAPQNSVGCPSRCLFYVLLWPRPLAQPAAPCFSPRYERGTLAFGWNGGFNTRVRAASSLRGKGAGRSTTTLTSLFLLLQQLLAGCRDRFESEVKGKLPALKDTGAWRSDNGEEEGTRARKDAP